MLVGREVSLRFERAAKEILSFPARRSSCLLIQEPFSVPLVASFRDLRFESNPVKCSVTSFKLLDATNTSRRL